MRRALLLTATLVLLVGCDDTDLEVTADEDERTTQTEDRPTETVDDDPDDDAASQPPSEAEWEREAASAISAARNDARTWSRAISDWTDQQLTDQEMVAISEEFWGGSVGTRAAMIDLGSPEARAAEHQQLVDGLVGFVAASARLQDCITRPDPSQCALADEYVREADEQLAQVEASL